jgi:hypothetical protein
MSDPTDNDDADGAETASANVVRVDFGRARAEQKPISTDAELSPDDKREREARHKEKLRVFTELVAVGMVTVTLDARHASVLVPERFKGDPQLNLNFSHRFGAADFGYDLQGVRCTLTFANRPFFCDVPWDATWGLRSHVESPDRVTVFHDALPTELLAMLPPAAREHLDMSQKRRDEARNPNINGLPEEATDGAESQAVPAKPAPASDRQRRGLRLVRDDDDS